ncbi:MAG: CspA family cold shock protein [Planctomycetota bacterium]|jgi:CspA family cold shock protein
MQTGTIARLVADRGFGFVAQEGVEKDLFFHSTELQNVQFSELHEGDTLEFEIEDGQKGPSAVRINKVDANAPQAEAAA